MHRERCHGCVAARRIELDVFPGKLGREASTGTVQAQLEGRTRTAKHASQLTVVKAFPDNQAEQLAVLWALALPGTAKRRQITGSLVRPDPQRVREVGGQPIGQGLSTALAATLIGEPAVDDAVEPEQGEVAGRNRTAR
jgi:hypothetical protein